MPPESFIQHVEAAILAACEPLHPITVGTDIYLYAGMPRGPFCARITLEGGQLPDGVPIITARLQQVGPDKMSRHWLGRGKLTVTPLDLGVLGNVRTWIDALKGNQDAIAILEEARVEQARAEQAGAS